MLNLPRAAIYLVTAMLLMLPAAAQNDSADPHAHDWLKEQAVPKLKQQAEAQTATQTATTTAAKSTADQVLDQSLGGLKPGYQGAHKWFADDQIGLIVVAVVAVLIFLIVGIYALVGKKKKSEKVE